MSMAGSPLLPPHGKVILNRVVGPSEEHEEIDKMAHGVMAETRSDEVFSGYQCLSLKQPNVHRHPGDIVEAGCLAAQMLPSAKYPLFDAIPPQLTTSGKLSDLQLEGILFACQRHQHILPNGQRAGFFIGDGAGVGKGRQISGIILDNFARGRCKHIWFSISSDLKMDAQRDLHDIDCYVKVIEGCQHLDKETKVFGLPPGCKEGVVFSTYATLVSSVQKGGSRQTRLQQLMDWCGGETFDGCLIFDESHKAKHFIPGKEENSTKIALAVTTLQRMLPLARVVYCSATGVTDVKNMAFMERLGLWGEGTAFKSFESFLESITKRGLGAAEMLAMEMKASGMYVSRGLSFRQAEFSNVESALTDEQTKVYDTAVHVWKEIKTSLEYALARTNTTNTRIWSLFWSSHQRFFKQLCMSMKVPLIVKEAKAALNDGYSVVIGLQTTGEASLESELNRNGGRINRFISICEEIMTRFITQYFPVKIQSTSGEAKEDTWAVTAKSLLLGFVKKINLPISPLDDLIDKMGGPDCVAEMTGRRGRVVRTAQDREPHYEARESDSSHVDSLNIQERNSFMSGSKLVAIISDAASTGISLHADLRAANQRRRVHVTIELPWSADKAVQQLGRSHRSNQSSGPIYKLVTTNLGGERRFAAAVARRLQSLGALTKGDRRAATGADLTKFNFDTSYGRSALRAMYQAINLNQLPGGVMMEKILRGTQNDKSYDFVHFNEIMKECLLSMGLTEPGSSVVKEKEAGDVSRFLNRILGLSVEKQNLIFSYFSECLNATIETAKREGKYNEGVTDLTASSITMVGPPCPVFTEVKGIMPTQHVTLSVDRGIEWPAAMKRYENSAQGKHDGFYWSKREQRYQRFYLLAIQKENSTHLFNIIRPNTGQSPFEEEKTDLLHKYTKISPDEAEKGWKMQYDKTRDHCFHGPGCKTGPLCRVGCRISRVHLLCGGIVPILSTLEWTVSRHAEKAGLSREDRMLRVIRVELDDGQRLVGLRYPEQLIPVVTALLKEQQNLDPLLGMQSGLLGLTLPQRASTKVATEESVSNINSRTLAKAINPPVTIKNFFRPKLSIEENTDAKGTDENIEQNNITSDGITRSEPPTTNSSHASAVRVSPPMVSAPTKPAPSASKRGRPPLSASKSNKRTASSAIGSRAKKSKQSSIFSSMGKGVGQGKNVMIKGGGQGKNVMVKGGGQGNTVSLKGEAGKEISADEGVAKKEDMTMACPICNKAFEKGVGNAIINQHIDNCLIV